MTESDATVEAASVPAGSAAVATATPATGTPAVRRRLAPEARRESILAAASSAFTNTPYEQVQVGAVAEAAGASEALVFRYFGTKAGLYAAVVDAAIAELAARRRAALDALPAGVPVRDRVQAIIGVYLDHVAEGALGWSAPLLAPGAEPEPVRAVRRAARDADVAALRALLGVGPWLRHEYAVRGSLGFLDAVGQEWVARGCLDDERESLVAAAVGALEGALGDWAT